MCFPTLPPRGAVFRPPLSLGGPTAVPINTAPCKAVPWLWVWAMNPMLLSPSRSLRPSLFGHRLLVCSPPEQPPCRLCHYPHGVAMGRCTSQLSLAFESYQPRYHACGRRSLQMIPALRYLNSLLRPQTVCGRQKPSRLCPGWIPDPQNQWTQDNYCNFKVINTDGLLHSTGNQNKDRSKRKKARKWLRKCWSDEQTPAPQMLLFTCWTVSSIRLFMG